MSGADGPGRVLALDLGDVRIGIARSDPLGITAQPVGVLRRVGPVKDLDAVARHVVEAGADRVVIGLPLLLSGEEGSRASEARAFAERLGKRLPGIAVELWDERLSTAEVERAMIADNVKRRRRRERIDALAATIILQGYLDAKSDGHATGPNR